VHPRLHFETRPEATAVIMAASGMQASFGDLEAAANRGAHAFRGLGLVTGDTIAMMSDNRLEVFAIFWAAQRSGLTLVPVSSRLKRDEIAYIVNDSGSKALLVSDALSDTALDLEARRAEMPGLSHLVGIGPIGPLADWNTLCAAQPATPIADEAVGGRMLYSSGTTGRPKGIRFPAATGTPLQPSPAALLFQKLYDLNEGTVYLSPAPLYHAAPLGMSTAIQAVGGTCVVMDKFEPEAFLAAIERYRVTVTQMVPTMFLRLLKLPEEVRTRYDLSSLKTVIHAAAPCPVPVKRAMIEWLGPIVEEYYAGSEGNGHVIISSKEWLAHPGSVGRAIVGTIHICDDEGNELPVGEVGTIYFGGGKPFAYHNDAVKTAASHNPLHTDWTTMGDVGRLDDEGYLYLSDRKDFMIISGGVNIYPQEVENLLLTHARVADAAVFGVPNEDFGEEVKAIVQPIDWAEAGDALAGELIGWCRERLADVKCPRSIEFEPTLPRAETGKLYKKELKARYWPAN
jgi:acyl-CoA synthetase (AMP-forming)/AMP-acid ligase II